MVNPLFKISKMVIFFKVLILRSGIEIFFIGTLIETIVKIVTLPIPSEISRENARAKVFCGIFFLIRQKLIYKREIKNAVSR